ncbi:MAG: acetoacetate decarboxylase family protein [Acidobacteriota bacterium]|nr:acetoacetate decarboxylase family protein [Acidobacteriota bacterium]
MKRSVLWIAAVCLGTVLTVLALMGIAQDKSARPARADFVPSPVFSPPYPQLPHHFRDVHTIQILCQAPKGAIQRALAKPLEQYGDSDLYVLLLAWTPDVEDQGFNVHEIAINTPVQWRDKVGNTTLIEYIDSDMGLIAGREIYGWPKKMADITWTQTTTGWMIVANKMKDQGSIPLMKIEYKVSDSTPVVRWPDMGPSLLVRRIPNASPSTPAFFQMVCVGCDMPQSGAPLVAPKGKNDTKGTATVQFFDGPHDPLTFLGPAKVLDAKMSIQEGRMPFGLGLGEVLAKWEE